MIKRYILSRLTDKEIEDELILRKAKLKKGLFSFGNIAKINKDKILKQEKDKDSYQKVMNILSARINHYDGEDKIKVIQSFINLISKDLMYYYMSIYSYNEDHTRPTLPSIVNYYKDQNGNEIKLKETYKESVDIKNKILIDCPYQTNKWVYHVLKNDELKPEMCNEGKATLYPSLNLVIIGSGNYHRTAEARLERETCYIPLYEYEDKPLYFNVKTDGYHWKSIYDDSILGECYDFRIALMFTLKSMQYNHKDNTLDNDELDRKGIDLSK